MRIYDIQQSHKEENDLECNDSNDPTPYIISFFLLDPSADPSPDISNTGTAVMRLPIPT